MNLSQSAVGLLPRPAGRHGLAVAHRAPVDTWNPSLWSGVSWRRRPAGRPGRGTAGHGTAGPGTAGPGPAGPGTTAAGTAQRGTALPGPARPGTARRGPGPPGTAPPGTAPPGTARHGTDGVLGRSQAMKLPRATRADRRGFRRGRPGHPARRRPGGTSAPGRSASSQWIVAAAHGRSAAGQLGVAGRRVPGRRVRGRSIWTRASSSSSPCSCRRWSPWGPWPWRRSWLRRARRRPLVKSAFNAGQVLIAAGLGLAVSRSHRRPPDPLTAGQVAAVVARAWACTSSSTLLLVAGVDGLDGHDLARSSPAICGSRSRWPARERWPAWSWRWPIRAHLWAMALAVPGLILERWLISARFAALHDRGRMEGLYEVTLEANRGLRQQAVLETILRVGTAAAPQPGGHPDLRWTRPRPAGRADDRGRPAAVAGRVGPAAG